MGVQKMAPTVYLALNLEGVVQKFEPHRTLTWFPSTGTKPLSYPGLSK